MLVHTSLPVTFLLEVIGHIHWSHTLVMYIESSVALEFTLRKEMIRLYFLLFLYFLILSEAAVENYLKVGEEEASDSFSKQQDFPIPNNSRLFPNQHIHFI